MHQLRSEDTLTPSWGVSGQVNFKMADLPLTSTVLQRMMVNYVTKIRLIFSGTIVSTAGTAIPRKVLTPMLISDLQLEGTEWGTPISSSHMKGGIIDINSYTRSGGRNPTFTMPGLTLVAATPKSFTHTVDVYLGNFSQRKGHQTCPLTLFMKPGELKINTPTTLASVHSSLADVTISACKVTAHAVLIANDQIIIANPWQLTRHKTTAANGADTVQINSFGASSTITGVQSKCGIHSVLWAGSGLVGSQVAGPGTVASIIQYAADFLGMRQNNDPRGIIQQLFDEITDGKVIDVNDLDMNNALYPFFDNEQPDDSDLDIQASAEVFPILIPIRDFDASKLFEAVGNPSYDLNGTFTPGASHYTFVDGCYPFTIDKLNDLTAIVQRAHIGKDMFGTDDLVLDSKMADNQAALSVAIENASKLTYLPRILVPRAAPAVK